MKKGAYALREQKQKGTHLEWVLECLALPVTAPPSSHIGHACATCGLYHLPSWTLKKASILCTSTSAEWPGGECCLHLHLLLHILLLGIPNGTLLLSKPTQSYHMSGCLESKHTFESICEHLFFFHELSAVVVTAGCIMVISSIKIMPLSFLFEAVIYFP